MNSLPRSSVLIVVALLAFVLPVGLDAAPCGSVLVYERQGPAALQGVALGGTTVVRVWEAGSGGSNVLASPCATGCLSLSGAPGCAGASECLAVTGLNWLNGGTCSTAGRRPARTVMLVERTTTAAGGAWAALSVEKNTEDANVDLDARAEAACGMGCASIASPYIGGVGQPIWVSGAQVTGGVLTLGLAWSAPPSVAQAINTSGSSLVSSYAIFARRAAQSNPPGATGDKTGWTRINDTDATQVGGFSLDTAAVVSLNLGASTDDVYVALSPCFDGTGNPTADANTMAGQYISMPVLAFRPGGGAPSVGSIKPRYGPTAGGTQLVVHGSGFVAGTSLHLGGAFATGVSVDAPTTLRANSAPRAAGIVDVTVVQPGGLSATLPAAFTYTDLPGTAIGVDRHAGAGTTGNLNGVLEPGENVVIEPAWTNWTGSPLVLTGTATSLTGPSGTTAVIVDNQASYGTIAAGDEQSCHDAGGDCYQIVLSVPAARPSLHWDLTLTELLSSGQTRSWTLHVGDSFTDVPRSHWAYRFVETLFHNQVTSGCNVEPFEYCPGSTLTRAQMAVLLLMAKHGPAWTPPAPSGTVFTDVPAGHWAAAFIEELVAEGITSGCAPGLYCPAEPITRAQMAVFLLMGKHGPGWAPPPPTGTVFTDVPVGHWAAAFIEQLAAEGITGGCAPGLYCPDGSVTRAQMAVFLTATFDLKLND